MNAIVALGLVGLLAHSAFQNGAFAESAFDAQGDPLPPGAIGRLGTVQRRGTGQCWLSPDGRTIVALDLGGALHFWDADKATRLKSERRFERPFKPTQPATPLPTAYATTGEPALPRLFADGRTLIEHDDGSLRFFDLFSLEKLDLKVPPKMRLRHVVLANDRSRLFLVVDQWGMSFVAIWDFHAGKTLHIFSPLLNLDAASPDGRYLVLAYPHGSETRLWDTHSKRYLWTTKQGNWCTAIFSPDSSKVLLGAYHGYDFQLCESATGKVLKKFNINEKKTPGSPGSLSPDGTLWLTSAHCEFTLFDLDKARITRRWRHGLDFEPFAGFAPDGRSVIACEPVLQRWDISSGASLYPDLARLGHASIVRELYISPDGKRLTSVGEDRTVRIWDVAARKLLHTIPVTVRDRTAEMGRRPDWVWCTSLDGKELIEVGPNLHVRERSLTDGRLRAEYTLQDGKKFADRMHPTEVRIHPRDGTLLLSLFGVRDGTEWTRSGLAHWRRGEGKLLRLGKETGSEFHGRGRGSLLIIIGPALSRDARWGLGGSDIYDFRCDTERKLTHTAHVFSPDSRWILGTTQDRKESVLIERVTGRSFAKFADTSDGVLSADGRWLATLHENHLTLWDVTSGKEACRHHLSDPRLVHAPAHGTFVRIGFLAFSPDGGYVATGHHDGTITLWPVPAVSAARPVADAEVEKLWRDLGDGDPNVGIAAHWRWSEDTAKLAAVMRVRLPLPIPPDDTEFARLFDALRGESFKERESATRRLEALGRVAEAPLRKRLQPDTPLEERRRIEKLLAILVPKDAFEGNDLRAMRAFAALERARTEEAIRLLRDWATRSPNVALAEEAANALLRLGK